MAVMSTSQSTSGGVKNLRAIFENRSSDLSSSPPSRGRSPNGSFTSQSRPLSKVRTSFVAIEKPSTSGGPIQLGLRRASKDLDESAIMDDTTSNTAGLGAILKGSPFEEVGSAAKPVSKTSKPGNVQTSSANGGVTKPAAASQKPKEGLTKTVPPKTAPTVKPPTTSQPPSKPKSPVETRTSVATAMNPNFPKPKGGVAKIQAVMQSAKEAQEGREAAARAKETKPEVSKVTSPTTNKAPRASLPARLSRPAGSATAPTASSVAKNEGHSPVEQKPAERKAVARGPPRVANATTASSLAKKSSRASLGGTEQPKPRTSIARGAADEGFLARMMRPTASSAQKTHDKAQTESPPRQRLSAPKQIGKPSRRSTTSTATQEADEDVSEAKDVSADASEISGDSQEKQAEIPATN